MRDVRKFPTIEEMHEDWETETGVSSRFSPMQRSHMKKAFMSGAAGMFRAMRDDVPEVSVDMGVEYVENLQKQFFNFFGIDMFES